MLLCHVKGVYIMDSIMETIKNNYVVPLVILIGLFLIRPLMNNFFVKKTNRSNLGNWITLYLLILFVLTYYQNDPWLFYYFISFGTFGINFNLLIVSFLILTLAFHISKLFTNDLLPGVYKRYNLEVGVQYTFNRLLHYLIMVTAFMFTISALGIELGSLAVFAGFLGVGIGFGLQNITSNFISGIILLFERPIKIGDRVVVNNIVGDVEKINMRATIIRSVNNERIIVPNSYFLQEHVINRSYESLEMRLVIPVGVSYGSDPERVRDVLLEVVGEEAEENSFVLTSPKPFINFVGFGDSSLDFELFLWISDPRQMNRVRTSVNYKIFRAFKQHSIEIPFPQRDIHIRTVRDNGNT